MGIFKKIVQGKLTWTINVFFFSLNIPKDYQRGFFKKIHPRSINVDLIKYISKDYQRGFSKNI